jgi:hypothetical protein
MGHGLWKEVGFGDYLVMVITWSWRLQ